MWGELKITFFLYVMCQLVRRKQKRYIIVRVINTHNFSCHVVYCVAFFFFVEFTGELHCVALVWCALVCTGLAPYVATIVIHTS